MISVIMSTFNEKIEHLKLSFKVKDVKSGFVSKDFKYSLFLLAKPNIDWFTSPTAIPFKK